MKIIQDKVFTAVGFGSPLMDITIRVTDEQLNGLGLQKGTMRLVDERESHNILSKFNSSQFLMTPGGSSANTMAGISILGGRSLLQGKIGDDPIGEKYKLLTNCLGVTTAFATGKSITGHAITLITPDGERTFATCLGSASEFNEKDIDIDSLANCKFLHIEGFMLENPVQMAACRRGAEIAKESGALISIDLSDPALVLRAGLSFVDFIKKYANIVFANEKEVMAFTSLSSPAKGAAELAMFCDLAVVKLGPAGSILKTAKEEINIPAMGEEVVNTNGAGDMYAAGILFGLGEGLGLEKSGLLGSHGAGLVVAQEGARLSEKFIWQDLVG